MRKKRKKRRLKVKNIVIALLVLAVIGGGIYFIYRYNKIEQKKKETNTLADIKGHYSEYGKVNKEADLYILEGTEYVKNGKIAMGMELTLADMKITKDTKYFMIKDFGEEYYIYYEDISKIDSLEPLFEQDRYKKYIPFNANIVTNKMTHFYDDGDKLLYTINRSFDLPIIIKDTNRYGVEFNNRLLFVKKDDVASVKENHNTDLKNADHIGALNYHFFWDNETESQSKCNQEICHSKSQFKSHLDLITEMNLLTITMKEAEMYIDGKVQLPKSVLITIDDGWRIELGIKMLNEYKMHGTVFLITSAYDPNNYQEGNQYVEFHSHTHNMHDGGKCPGGQGGGIKCLPHDTILSDLKASSEKLGGSTVLCYPFYEYNDYAIGIVKEAGYTMAFAGESSYRDNHIKVGSNKYTLPRFVIVTYTTMNDLKAFLK